VVPGRNASVALCPLGLSAPVLAKLLVKPRFSIKTLVSRQKGLLLDPRDLTGRFRLLDRFAARETIICVGGVRAKALSALSQITDIRRTATQLYEKIRAGIRHWSLTKTV
jgi:hypothetical protein